MSFCCRVLVEMAGFWTTDVRGLTTVYIAVSNVLGGVIVPLTLFPPALAALARATPFPSMLQIPVDIAVEHRSGSAALTGLAVQAAWVVVLLAATSAVLRRATRKVVVQGG